MTEHHHRWYSPSLSQDIEVLAFGTRGYPVILFPTSLGRYYENKDFKLIESVAWFIEEGLVKIYCPDGIDRLSWYNKSIHPAERVKNHVWYDLMVCNELVPLAQRETGVNKVATAGCSFGGYHATNFAFRHPNQVAHLFTMGAAFDIRQFVDGYHDENVYFNNPPEYLPNAQNEHFQWMNIILGTAEHDFCKNANFDMARILSAKNIPYTLDVKPFGDHDWPVWREMFPQYLNTIG